MTSQEERAREVLAQASGLVLAPSERACVIRAMLALAAKVREDAAKVCEAYSGVNFEMAGDSVLLDPVLRGKGFSPENVKESERQQAAGLIHSAQAHAGKHLAAAIRAQGGGR